VRAHDADHGKHHSRDSQPHRPPFGPPEDEEADEIEMDGALAAAGREVGVAQGARGGERVVAVMLEQSPVGVCLIVEGRDVGEPALPAPVGTLATIATWDMPLPLPRARPRRPTRLPD